MNIVNLPPPMYADSEVDTKAACTPRCAEPMVDVVHVTGEGNTFYVLNEHQQRGLLRQIEQVEALMAKLRAIIAKAVEDTKPAPCQVLTGNGTVEACPCMACEKLRWAREAEQLGLLALNEMPAAVEPIRLETAEDIQGRIATLRQQREAFASLCAWWNAQASTSCRISHGMTQVLDAEIEQLKAQLSPVPRRSESTASSTLPGLGERSGKGLSYQRTRASGDNRVMEIIVFSRPGRRYYLSTGHHKRLQSGYRIESDMLLSPTPLDDVTLRQRARQLLGDIRDKVASGLREDSAKPLGNLEVTFTTWTAPHDSAANALHREIINWSSDDSDGAPYAANAEAHLLRFAAQASAGFSGFDPKQGEISVGVKGQASFALAEGKVSLERYLPQQSGYDCWFAYRNAEGQTVYHRFGALRLRGALELSCFVGAMASGEASAGVKWRASPSGASAMLTAPELTSRGGAIKVQGNAFAGAQAGGALVGALEWLAPDAQDRPNASWSALLQIQGEGNVALGIGAGLDFQIQLTGGRLYFHIKAQLVFGPGASGGFGTQVDLEQAGALLLVVYRNLSEVDYRHLLSINEGAFELFYQVMLKTLTTHNATVESVLQGGLKSVQDWWDRRQAGISTAEALARRILHGQPLLIHGQPLALNELPPEVMGPALYLLSESYVFTFSERREQAIIRLLQLTRTWRHFYLTLERMHPQAQPTSAHDALKRIRSFLTRRQNEEFSRFIDALAGFTDQAPANTQLSIAPWSMMGLHNQHKFAALTHARKHWSSADGSPTMTA